MGIYDSVKAQIKMVAGIYEIDCPICGRKATAHVDRARKEIVFPHRKYHWVKTTCRCGGSVDFVWYRQ